MRLGQLARKFNMKPTEIADFLQEKLDITIELDLNFRVEDKAIEALEQLVASKTVKKATEKPAPVSATPPKKMAEPKELEYSNLDLSSDVIRAPKTHLEGLKVLGKIDLPTKKTEESDVLTEEAPEHSSESDATEIVPEATPIVEEVKPEPIPEGPSAKELEKERRDKEEREYAKRMNELAEKRRIQEAKEAEEKRIEQEKIQKEIRRKHYLNQVKNNKPKVVAAKKSTPATAAPITKEAKPIEAIKPEIQKKEVPTTFFGRFWHWLNT